jgi:putative tryptophan/tyrosine transport system substrate-binding protein
MNRRQLLLLGAVLTAPGALRAQQKALPVVGFLNALDHPPSTPAWAPFLGAFHQGLSDTGYVDGQNASMEYRSAESDYDRLPALAAELVTRKVDVIVAIGGASARAAKNATSAIPIVFMGIGDPVRLGLVPSLARPGGNITGISNSSSELEPKRLELLSEMVPQAKVIAMLVNPGGPASAERFFREVQEAARVKGVQLPILKASTEGEIDGAFASLAELHAGALFVRGDPFFYSRREQFGALAAHHAVPTMYMWPEFARSAGGLISYGINGLAPFREAGVYAGRILKGTKPTELPVQQPTKFEMVINLKTATKLGLTVPQSLLARADEVIDNE